MFIFTHCIAYNQLEEAIFDGIFSKQDFVENEPRIVRAMDEVRTEDKLLSGAKKA